MPESGGASTEPPQKYLSGATDRQSAAGSVLKAHHNKSRRSLIVPAILAVSLLCASFLLQGHIRLNIYDEGYLWHGAQYTAKGGIPQISFEGYEPGRYYWSALFFWLLDDGIITLRISIIVLQCAGLFLALTSVRKTGMGTAKILLLGMTITVWMFPVHKGYEHAIILSAVFVLSALAEEPTILRHFLAGVFVGAAGFFGLNHGLYTSLASFFMILLVTRTIGIQGLLSRIGAWAGGIVIGFSPALVMLMLIPGLFSLYVDMYAPFLSEGITNLTLPIPWPWVTWEPIITSSDAFPIRLGKLFVSLGFVLLPLMYSGVLAVTVGFDKTFVRSNPVLVAASLVGLFYFHQATSRADASHLAQSIHPFLICIAVLPYAVSNKSYKATWIFTTAFLIIAAASAAPYNPLYQKMARPEHSPYVQADIAGDTLWLDPGILKVIRTVQELDHKLNHGNGNVFIAPHLPGLYCILDKRAIVRSTYFLFPLPEQFQKRIVDQIEKQNVTWAVIGDVGVDNRDDLRFSRANELVWKYFQENYVSEEVPGLPDGYRLYTKPPRR